MTELLHKEFSRTTFLKGGGALVVGFSMLGAARATAAAAQTTDPPFPQNQVDAWLVIHPDNTATILGGQLELGQGTGTGMRMIAGEELGMNVSQLNYVGEETGLTPSIGGTGGSNGIKNGGRYVRSAAAHARNALLQMASATLGVPVSNLSVKDGVVSGGGKSVTYGDLVGGKMLNVTMSKLQLYPSEAPAKHWSQYTLVGTRVPRVDIPAKVAGTHTYIHQVKLPGMLHARIVRPRGQGAWGDGTNPAVLSVDERSIRNIAGARVVRKGNFIGVVAPTEFAAIQAAAQLKVKWADVPTISSSGNIWKRMRELEAAGQVNVRPAQAGPDQFEYNINPEKVDDAIASAAIKHAATYTYTYNTHGHIGPHCCVADVRADGATIFSNTQSAYGTRDHVASLLGLRPSSIYIKFYEGGGAFGRGGATGKNYNEPVASAALISQLVGKPVRLQYMRWDDFGWQMYAPPIMFDIRGGVDANGRLVGVDLTSTLPGETTNSLTSAGNVVQQQLGLPNGPTSLAGVHGHGTAGAAWNRPAARGLVKTVPLEGNFFKNSAMRSVKGPQTGWAYAQFMDELAYAAKMDPVEFFRLNVTRENRPDRPWFHDHRWLAIIESTAKMAKWEPRVAASRLSSGPIATGRGIAVSTHSFTTSAVAASIQVNKRTGKVVVKDLYVTQDTGLSVNPALVENQMIGGVIMAASRVLHEQVAFNTKRVTSLDWVTYPIMRFAEHPNVHTRVIQRMDQRTGGSGEVPMDATVASIGNAFFDATGVRLRDAPITPAKVRAALKAAGVT